MVQKTGSTMNPIIQFRTQLAAEMVGHARDDLEDEETVGKRH